MKGSLRIPPKFFVSGPIAAASDDAKLVAGHLWTGPHMTVLGCFRLPTAYLAGDLGWAVDRTESALAELLACDFIARDERTGWTLIPSFVSVNPIHNRQAGAGAVAVVADLPPTLSFSNRVLEILRPFGERLLPAAQARISQRSSITTTLNAADNEAAE